MTQSEIDEYSKNLETGDLISVDGSWFFSKLIKWWTKTDISHVGIVIEIEVNEERQVCVFEAMEGYGVRLISLDRMVKEALGTSTKIYHQKLLSENVNKKRMIDFLLDNWGNEYPKPYQFILIISPIMRKLRNIFGRSDDQSVYNFHCAELIAAAIRYSGIIMDKPSVLMTPNDISKLTVFGQRRRIL